MPAYAFPESVLMRITTDSEICSRKLQRRSIILWRGKRWRVWDRSWDRLHKEWHYAVIPA